MAMAQRAISKVS
uniref:Uncharacterized protein n=1 Tax=Arundo donax TaxID=35708 RepID=A0A0A9FJR3_ARUDO